MSETSGRKPSCPSRKMTSSCAVHEEIEIRTLIPFASDAAAEDFTAFQAAEAATRAETPPRPSLLGGLKPSSDVAQSCDSNAPESGSAGSGGNAKAHEANDDDLGLQGQVQDVAAHAKVFEFPPAAVHVTGSEDRPSTQGLRLRQAKSHFALSDVERSGLDDPEGTPSSCRPVLGLFTASGVKKDTVIADCSLSCIFIDMCSVDDKGVATCLYPHKSAKDRKALIVGAVLAANEKLSSSDKAAFSLTDRYEMALTGSVQNGDLTAIVGSPKYSLFFCANAVDGVIVGEGAGNCSFKESVMDIDDDDDDEGNQRTVVNATIVPDRDLLPGEEIIINFYTVDAFTGEHHAKPDHRWNVLSVIPAEYLGIGEFI
jgi:hypothetical protein